MIDKVHDIVLNDISSVKVQEIADMVNISKQHVYIKYNIHLHMKKQYVTFVNNL